MGKDVVFFSKLKGVHKHRSSGNTVLMAYAKTKLKSHGFKAFPL